MNQKNFNDRKGQALVEFALALPLVLLLVLGVLEFGRAFQTKIVLTNAAREGAHYFIYDKNDNTTFTNTKDAVVAEAFNSGVNIQTADVTVHCYDGGSVDDGCPSGSTVEVLVTNLFELQIIGSFIDPLPINSTARMLVP
jgi:Flp pilus assembly protein TadG